MPRILVAEDNNDARELMAEALTSAGHDVESARDGVEAEAKLGLHAFDLVVLDLMMPRMSGWELRARMLRDRRLASVPVLVITADATTSVDDWSMVASGFIEKPFNHGELLEAVTRALRGGVRERVSREHGA